MASKIPYRKNPEYITSDYSNEETLPQTNKGFSVQHNLYDLLGSTLLEGIEGGRLNFKKMKEMATRLRLEDAVARLTLDLGKGYKAGVGYGEYIGPLRQDVKFTLSKDF